MTQGGWRKSSHSGASGQNDCVEVGWHKSSHSGGGDNDCVEVAVAASAVGVRDSKNTSGPTLAFSPTAWRNYTRSTPDVRPGGGRAKPFHNRLVMTLTAAAPLLTSDPTTAVSAQDEPEPTLF
jgi:hypothetical protein